MSVLLFILVSFREGVEQKVRDQVYERYQRLPDLCGGEDAGILFWMVRWNLDQRKGVHLVQFFIFKDEIALQNFRAHPKHKEHVEIVKDVADWQVGKMELDFPISIT